MAELINLNYDGAGSSINIKTIVKDGKPLFCLNDLIGALRNKNEKIDAGRALLAMKNFLNAMLDKLPSNEIERIPFPNDNNPDATEMYVTEPGMYRVVMSDTTEPSLKFQYWIFNEVLPSIREFGCYPPPIQTKSSGLLAVAELVTEEIRQRQKLEQKVDAVAEKVEQIASNNDLDNYSTVEAWLTLNKVKDIDSLHLIALCEKLCAEKFETSLKSASGNREDTKFPVGILKTALEQLKT